MEPFVYEPDGATCAARMIGYVAGLLEQGMKVKLEEVERYERPMKIRLAFRFGVITVTGGIQAVIRVRISLPDGRSSQGVAAEALAAKWFEKSPEFTDEQNLDQLRQSLDLAIEHYKAYGAATPFDLFVGTYREQQKKGAALQAQSAGRLLRAGAARPRDPRCAGQGHGQFLRPDDRARTCRASRPPTSRPTSSRCQLQRFLAGLKPQSSIELRHTVGLVDPLTAGDRTPMERINDGLPETLEEVVSYYRGRYYKLKVGGDIKADLERLGRIAFVLDRRLPETTARRSTATSSTTTSKASSSCGARSSETPALARLVEVDAVHRAADQARRWR